jgi:hypothetical protein
VEEAFFPKAEMDELAGYLRSVHGLPKTPPKALLVVSAHWEEPVPTVTAARRRTTGASWACGSPRTTSVPSLAWRR